MAWGQNAAKKLATTTKMYTVYCLQNMICAFLNFVNVIWDFWYFVNVILGKFVCACELALMKVCECDLRFFIFVNVIWGVSYFVIVWTDPPLPTLLSESWTIM